MADGSRAGARPDRPEDSTPPARQRPNDASGNDRESPPGADPGEDGGTGGTGGTLREQDQ